MYPWYTVVLQSAWCEQSPIAAVAGMCDAWRSNSEHEGTYVKIYTHDGVETQGFFYTCDPETGNIVLLQKGPKIVLLSHEHVLAVISGGPLPVQIPTELPPVEQEHKAGLKCETVLEGLRVRRISAKVVDDCTGKSGKSISVFDGAATIFAPFTSASCRSTNDIILLRVRKVLDEIYRDSSSDANPADDVPDK